MTVGRMTGRLIAAVAAMAALGAAGILVGVKRISEAAQPVAPTTPMPLRAAPQTDAPVNIGSRLELFVDELLVGSLKGTSFKLHTPTLAPQSASPLKGSYTTIIRDGGRYRAYYRRTDPNHPYAALADGSEAETTRYAESRDGREWTFPELGLCEFNGSTRNNIVLHRPPFCHNFAPFLDTNPEAPPGARYKALAGLHPVDGRHYLAKTGGEGAPAGRWLGLHAFQSADGLHWELMHDKPVITDPIAAFDSLNVSFWSAVEERYVCYYRSLRAVHGRRTLRTISRTTSRDYLNWEPAVDMAPNLPGEHLYTNGTHPYFRAPHIYIALPTRCVWGPDRYAIMDILFMATRPGQNRYTRLFTEPLIRPGLDPERWGQKVNTTACGIVPTGPAEMSIYHEIAGQRYVLRTDGFISINAGADRGEFVTKPLIFSGRELVLNFSTSAAGWIRVELIAEDGVPQGFALANSKEIFGDSIERVVSWENGSDVSACAGKPVRLRFVMKEADLFSMRFRE